VPSIGFPAVAQTDLPPELEMGFAAFTLRGTSVAARATAFAIPELQVALDLGRLTPVLAEQPVVLLSHAHLDHLAGVLAYLNLRARFFLDRPPRLYCPAAVAAPLREALALMPGVEAVRKRLDLQAVICGVAAGEEVALAVGRARAFAADHGIPALGWTLLDGTGGRPLCVYAGDGSTDPFLAAPELLDAEVAIVECSFVERNRRIAARLARHAHLADWVRLAPRLTCDALVLAHLPQTPASALDELAAPLAKAFPGRLVLWVASQSPVSS
jgi:ribonuclease BN (tRNA processing enzyme)